MQLSQRFAPTGDFAGTWIFGYEQALRMCGCEIRWLHLKEENGFSLESTREELYAMLCDGSGDASKIDSVPNFIL